MDTFQGDLIFNQVFDLDIRMFLLLYETRSFSKTALIVGCNQPAVSKRISKLEESLGITLFDRSQRPIRPTSSARILYSEMKNHAGKIQTPSPDFVCSITSNRYSNSEVLKQCRLIWHPK